MSKPNIVCVSIDSLRLDACSAYDSQRSTTPVMDNIADEGICFDRAISPSTWTFPVHASLFTGLYPLEHGLRDHGDTLGNHPTFAELLSDVGYDTRSFGYNVWLERGGLLRGFDHTSTTAVNEGKNVLRRTASEIQRKLFRTAYLDKQTVRNVEHSIDAANEPFCAFVHFQGAHHKYRPYPRYARQYSDSIPGILRARWDQRRLYDQKRNRFFGDWRPDENSIEEIWNLYSACVRHVDDRIRDILDWLRESGVYENTIVFVLADHGDCFGEDDIFGHQFSVADELIRVPLLVLDPTDTLSEIDHEDIVQTLDLYPTILNLCGIDPVETNAVGLTDEDTRENAFVHYRAAPSLYEALGDSHSDTKDEIYSVWRDKDTKLSYYPASDSWLGSDDESLRVTLENHLDSLASVAPDRGAELEDDVERRLRDMGYL